MENDILIQHQVREEIVSQKENPRYISEGLPTSPSFGLKLFVYAFLAICVAAAIVIYSYGGNLIFPLGSFY